MFHLSGTHIHNKHRVSSNSNYLYTALSGQFNSCVVVSAAQQMLHHHAVHAFLLPQVDWGRLVAAVFLQVLDATFAQLGTLVFCLDGLSSLQDINTQEQEQQRHLQKPEYASCKRQILVQIFGHSISILLVTSLVTSASLDFLKEGAQFLI